MTRMEPLWTFCFCVRPLLLLLLLPPPPVVR